MVGSSESVSRIDEMDCKIKGENGSVDQFTGIYNTAGVLTLTAPVPLVANSTTFFGESIAVELALASANLALIVGAHSTDGCWAISLRHVDQFPGWNIEEAKHIVSSDHVFNSTDNTASPDVASDFLDHEG